MKYKKKNKGKIKAPDFFTRVILEGTLITKSPLHIGTGEWMQVQPSDDTIRRTVNTVALDSKNNPYIPASGIRGVLRSLCPTAESDLKKIIYGESRAAEDDLLEDKKNQGNGGAIRLYDAKVVGNCILQEISRTSIDPITQTAKQHSLSTLFIVPKQTQFTLEVELDNVNVEAVSLVLASLDALQYSWLGKGKSIGQGRVEWKLDAQKSQVLPEKNFKQWIKKPAKQPLSKSFVSLKSIVHDKKLQRSLTALWKTQEIKLKAQSPILVNDPQTAEQADEHYKRLAKEKQTETEQPAKLVALSVSEPLLSTTGKHVGSTIKAIIPGSTVKGWVRARCRKILLTLSHDEAGEINVESLLKQLFGGTEEGLGKLLFSDLEVNRGDLRRQYFNAIDRFSGGVKEGALYSVEPVFPTNAFEGVIHYQPDELSGWMKLLLLYVLRDAVEGDLRIGWGKSRGYGRLTLEANVNHWLTQFDEELEGWDQELQQKLASFDAAQPVSTLP